MDWLALIVNLRPFVGLQREIKHKYIVLYWRILSHKKRSHLLHIYLINLRRACSGLSNLPQTSLPDFFTFLFHLTSKVEDYHLPECSPLPCKCNRWHYWHVGWDNTSLWAKGGGYLVHYRIFSSIPGLYFPVSSTIPSPMLWQLDVANCPLRGEIAPMLKYCSKSITHFLLRAT